MRLGATPGTAAETVARLKTGPPTSLQDGAGQPFDPSGPAISTETAAVRMVTKTKLTAGKAQPCSLTIYQRRPSDVARPKKGGAGQKRPRRHDSGDGGYL
jgi:hypothetical protein